MSATIEDIKNRLNPPFKCTKEDDLRGSFFSNTVFENYEGIDFSGAVLYQCYPSGLQNAIEICPKSHKDELLLTGLDLTRSNFKEASLREVDFGGLNLMRVNFKDSDLSSTVFENANLYGAILIGANLEFTNLKNCNLETATITFADIRDADLQGAKLMKSDIRYSNLEGSDLRNADLTNANIVDASFQYADLRGTNLTQCVVSFRDAYFKGAKYDSTTIFPMDFPKQIKDSMTFMDTHI